MLFGITKQDRGEIQVDGQAAQPRSPRHAMQLGISISARRPPPTRARAAISDRDGRPDRRLILDALHTYTTNIGEKEIASLAAAQIVHVHVSDVVKGKGRAGARSDERLLPSQGEVDLAGFLRGLGATGYQGYIAVEVIAAEDIAKTPDAAAARIRSSLRELGL